MRNATILSSRFNRDSICCRQELEATVQSHRIDTNPNSPRIAGYGEYGLRAGPPPAFNSPPSQRNPRSPRSTIAIMLEPQHSKFKPMSTPRAAPTERNIATVEKSKRLSPPSGSQPPAGLWDKLLKVWLTKRTLNELDRRNTQAAPSPPGSLHRRARRPVTRNFLTESKGNRQTARYTADYLGYCEPRILKDMKLFATHEGSRSVGAEERMY